MTHFQQALFSSSVYLSNEKTQILKGKKEKETNYQGNVKLGKESSGFWKADLNKTVNPFVHNDFVVNFLWFEENNNILDISDDHLLNNYDYCATSNKSSIDCIYPPI